MKVRFIQYIFTSILFALTVQLAFAQKVTVVKGNITDAKTKDAMLYVNVQFDDTTIGTTSDNDGNFYIETPENVSKLKVSYIGYATKLIAIQTGKVNELNIKLEDEGVFLNEVVVKTEKYKNKGNPAVELINKVIDNKEKNRKEGLAYFSYSKHDKVEFSLNNITEKMRNNFLFKKVKFIFENVDTNKVTGAVNLPIFLKENISDIYWRKETSTKKEYIRAEKITNIDEIFNSLGISNMMTNMYQDIDFYENTIMLLTNGFVSPLSNIAPNIYRFYIQDTSVVNGTSMIHLYFAPRTKTDMAFMGHMWIANDSTYALRKIEAGIPKDINLNWVKDLQIIQEYEWAYELPEDTNTKKGLMLKTDDIIIDFGISKKDSSRSILGRKSTTYQRVTINKPIPEAIFDFAGSTFRENDANKKPEIYWQENRHNPLSESEMGIYQMVDSLKNHKPFKRLMTIGRLLFEGYTPIGAFNLGPANTFYSFNPVEGFRLRLGGRTNMKFSEKMMLEGYAAYGFKDEKIKGYAALRYNFGSNQILRFPYNQLKVWYQDDVKIPGQDLQFIQEDNFLLSLKRGVNDKMIYTKTEGIEYLRENSGGFSYSMTAKKTVQRPGGALLFDYDLGEKRVYKNDIMSSELGLMLRYAPNEKFYEGATYRTPLLNKFPIFELRYTAGLKGQSVGEYSYHNIHLKAKKVFYLAPFGYAELIVEGGRIFGQVPYPLLTTHRANQTFAYQLESYNLMNFLEFVSDKYASVNYQHNFQGVFFGRLPILKNLKWREVISFKGLWGGLDDKNNPDGANNLLKFPVDQNGNVLTHTLEKKPYIETSVGVSNIFKVLRVDYVRRLNYTDLPNVSKWGIRARLKVEF